MKKFKIAIAVEILRDGSTAVDHDHIVIEIKANNRQHAAKRVSEFLTHALTIVKEPFSEPKGF